ncbi:MAG: hypothetical protein L0Z63_04355 [Actinobacteria bacterium]|nr:hypothetical protein [Actinomycetota bacterium]
MTDGPYYMLASMDVDPSHESLFHEVYNEEHVPNLARVPGILSIARLRPISFRLAIGGGFREVEVPSGEPAFTAMYTLTGPEVLESEAFGAAVEEGRWPADVRPHTRNRRHVLYAPFDGRK